MEKATINIEIDREVGKHAKVVAAQEGITLKAYVERCMLAYATRWPKSYTAPTVTERPKSSPGVTVPVPR